MDTVKQAESQKRLIQSASEWLRARLPEDWQVETDSLPNGGVNSIEDFQVDSILTLRNPDGTRASMPIEARSSFSPRDAETLLPRIAQMMRSLSGDVPLLVVAPWLSRQSQEALAARNVNYIDATGNSRLRLRYPTLYVQTEGASRDPLPRKRGRPRLTGSRAARLIRLLADVRPPYGVSELATGAELTPGYVSQLLTVLYDEALIERSARGPVTSVDVAGLIRRWAETYRLFKTNTPQTFVAPNGIEDLQEKLVGQPRLAERIAITGSPAASRLAPVTIPATLTGYCEKPTRVAEDLGLLPAEEGGNVILLEPFDPVAWRRTVTAAGLRFAATSQVAVDCLTGNGRMPAAGEALLEWMKGNEDLWRYPSLTARGPSAS